MEIKTTENIFNGFKDTIYLDKRECDRIKDVKWVKVDDVELILTKLIGSMFLHKIQGTLISVPDSHYNYGLDICIKEVQKSLKELK